MGLLSDAAGMARGRLGAIVFSASLPLVPACLLAGGIVRVATAHARAQLDTQTRGEAFAEKSRDLPANAPAEQKKDILLQAKEPGAPRPRTVSFALLAGGLFALLVLVTGVFIAQGVLLHLAVGGCETARACGALAPRSRALFSATGSAVVLTATGFAAC